MTAPIEAQAWTVLASCRHESHPFPVFASHTDAVNEANRGSNSGVRCVVMWRPDEWASWRTVQGWDYQDAIRRLWIEGPLTDRACLTCGSPTGDASPPPGPMGCAACPPIVCVECGLADHITAGCLCWRAVDMVRPDLLAGLTS